MAPDSHARDERTALCTVTVQCAAHDRPRCNFRAASVQNVRATCTGSAGTLIFRSASISRKVRAREIDASPMRTRTACNHLPSVVRSLRLRIYESYDQGSYAMARTRTSISLAHFQQCLCHSLRSRVTRIHELFCNNNAIYARDCFTHQSCRLREDIHA